VITNIPNTTKFKRGTPIFLVVDYRMPQTDGLEFMRQFVQAGARRKYL